MLIESFHSGTPGQRRYCSLHRPATRLVKSAGVVLCHPLGHEYYRAYRAYVKLANALAECGFPVLRFDYTGTGDSEGDAGHASLSGWIADIHAAMDDLRRNEDVSSVILGGMRFGGTLAALAANGNNDVSAVLLWDAIDDGARYLKELRRLHADMLRDQERFARQRRGGECAPTELVGATYPSRLLADIEKVSLASDPRWIRATPAANSGRGVSVHDYGWRSRHRIEESVVDPAAVRAFATRLNAAVT